MYQVRGFLPWLPSPCPPPRSARFAIWPKVREFIDGLPSGALVADVGCGNGKYFGVRDDIVVIGSDRSPGAPVAENV